MILKEEKQQKEGAQKEKKYWCKRFLNSWGWLGFGIFVMIVSILFYCYQKNYLDDSGSLLLIGLTFGILLFLTGIVKLFCETLEKKKQVQPLVIGRKARISALKMEYRELTEAIRHRGRQYLLLESILISGALVATAALIRDPINDQPFVAKGTLVAAISMVIIGWLLHLTTGKLDKKFWARVHTIETQLGIQGHNKLYKEEIQKKWWFRLRTILWHSLFTILTFFFILGIAYYFDLIDFPFFT